jgi:hypothetical protein
LQWAASGLTLSISSLSPLCRTVKGLSQAGLFINAADWAINLSTLTNFFASGGLTQTRREAPPPPPPGARPTHAVGFLMTDGDNLQWLLRGFADPASDWWASPSRGKVALGWTLSPALAELAPSVIGALYGEAAAAGAVDGFVAGPSGAGYAFPEVEAGDARAAFGNLTAALMAKADLRLINVIEGGPADPAQVEYLLDDPRVEGMILYSYDQGYAGGKGACLSQPCLDRVAPPIRIQAGSAPTRGAFHFVRLSYC